MVEPTVNSRSGSANSPFRIRSPSAPVEKSPLTGFTPEWRPVTLCNSTPSSMAAIRSAGSSRPGSNETAWTPTPGVVEYPRTAEPVDEVPHRRAVQELWTN